MFARILLAASVLAAATAEPPADRFQADGLIELQAETLVVGADGTRRAGMDRAVLAPGKTGLLRLEVPLAADAAGGRDRVTLNLQVKYTSLPADPDHDGGPAVRLDVSSTAQARPSGEVVIRSSGGRLDRPGSIFHDAFVSSATGERIVVNFDVAPWREPPAVPGPRLASDPRPVQYRVSIYRQTEQGLDFLGMPVLQSLIGRSVFYSFGFTLAGDDGEVTGEEMRLEIRSVELRDDRLTGTASLTGMLRGTPVSATTGWSLRSGEEQTVTLSFGQVGGEDLGATMVIATTF